MYNFIPKRKEKIKNSGNLEENKNLSLEALFLKDIDEEIIDNLEKERILTKFLENNKFKEIISEIEKEEKGMLNLTQFKRFYDFIKERRFDFFDEEKKVIDFIEKQKERKIATKFYEFIKEEFIEKPLKTKEKELTDEFRKSESQKNKQSFRVLEKYLLYIFGKKRMEKN
ncbi:hypothetical protein [Leptotrichia trevisanii]|uniref:hypothetical protein n=1 Tax=Leptotrichia trevisanii TaxID=109328 RepID=UPI0026EB21E3|nr:hypothetical protein [Leptotrichia trevisanii]